MIMIMTKINSKVCKIIGLIFLGLVSGCQISPGIHLESESSWIDKKEYVYIPLLEEKIYIKDISSNLGLNDTARYRIGIGDIITYQVWGLPDIFPVANNRELNIRRIDSNGEMYFPFVGPVLASGKTADELRDDVTMQLSEYFNDPQIDISIFEYKSRKVYIFGEVMRPQRINLTDVPISLADAIGVVNGLNSNTSDASEIFLMRQPDENDLPQIFRADLSNPAGILDAGNFYLKNNDVVYVNAKGTTRWNKVVSQFFPFSSFLNSVDRLIESE